ncbi:hypothetical protein BGZ83_010622 [Gryganskiella cystojenkinii]|nr:hypothetical protein BGZ83_010622 [Gryganskiella cystojenkinii]
MTADPDSALLTPPPDPAAHTLLKDMDNDIDTEREIVEEVEATTTRTTTKIPKGFNSLKGLDTLVSQHHNLATSSNLHHLNQSSPSSDGNGSDLEDEPRLLEEEEITTKTVLSNKAPTTITFRAPSASYATILSSAPTPISTKDTLPSSSRLPGQQKNDNGSPSSSRGGIELPESSSSSSLSSSTRSSTGPGTPSSTDGYHTISTTTITTKKRKVRRPTFEPRSSRLDPENMNKNQDPFRGFHTLFWIVMGAYGIITFDEEWTRVGKAFGGTLFSSFSEDAIILAISDFGLVLSTGIAFLLVKVVAKGWIRYQIVGMVIQHCVQVLFLLVAIAWTIWRDWPWVQSGFFTLHAITMLMKMHSYIAYNGELSEKKIQLKKLEESYAQLKKDDALTTSDDIGDLPNDTPTSPSPSTESSPESSLSDQEKEILTSRQHHRLASEAAAALLQEPVNSSALAAEIDELKHDLRCQNGEPWPANVTTANFVDFLIVPSLIYELQYPRTTKIRPMYVFEKSVATLGTFTLLYLTTEHYIYPVVFDPTISPLRALVLLLIPFMMNYLMIFYIIFECICNAFAELSRFADRNFYEDWWNCVSFDEWARKWNKPVHHFLLRHVYDSSIESFHLSKSNAALATFFLSSCVHELVMMVVTRKVRLYLFALQMFQLPLIWMGNNKYIRETPRLANAFFWLGMFCGPPLLGVAYCYA